METSELTLRAGLAKKMLAVMDAVSHVEKSGYNESQKYHYTTEADTVAAIRRAMVDAKLMLSMSATAAEYHYETDTRSGNKMRIIRVNLKITWIDTDTGYAMTEFFDGEGSDTGDKAIYKAITGAEKYALLKTFLVPTGDDPEKDDEDKKKNDGKKAESAPNPPPAQPRTASATGTNNNGDAKTISVGQSGLVYARKSNKKVPDNVFFEILIRHGATADGDKAHSKTLPATALNAVLKEIDEYEEAF